MSKPGLVVAIDGPSGSGKSSVARQVAARLAMAYLDTGAMYRAATLWLLDQGVDLDDHAAAAKRLAELPLEIGLDPAGENVRLAGRDVGTQIRASSLSKVVSKVATNLDARALLIERQRQLIAAAAPIGGIVAEGRDITTVVAPEAGVRILLTASPAARLARRALDVHGDDSQAAVAATRDEVVRRDRDDSTVADFMQAAPGVTTIDSTDLDFEQTVAAVLRLIEVQAP